jgi:hypothetical protein
VAIAALVLWLCTAAVGSYLLATAIRTRQAPRPADDERPVPVTLAPAAPAAPAEPRRARDRYDPPSLVRAKSEPLPGLRALAEFTHPALAIVGLGLWLGYVLSRDRMFAAIGFGVLLGAICAGLTWFAGNRRAARRAQPGNGSQPDALSFAPRLLVLHAAGAAITLLFVALIAARV